MFVEEIISIFKNLDMSNITNKKCLKNMVNNLNLLVNWAWNKNVKQTRIIKHSKQWWTEELADSLTTTGYQEVWITGRNLRKLLRTPKGPFSTWRSKKLQTRVVVHRNWWTKSTSKSYLLSRPLSMKANHVLSQKAYSKLFMPYLTLHSIIKSIPMPLIK